MSARLSAAPTASGVPVRMRLLSVALLLLRSLTRGWCRVEELAAEHDTHKRVVYRHLAAMRHIGLRLERERAEHGARREIYWHVSSGELARWLSDTAETGARPRKTQHQRRSTT